MSVRNLGSLFRPSSVAVVGASNRPGSVGSVVTRNLLRAGFEGPVMPVNPRARAVAGVLAHPSLEALPIAPELVVVCTPAATVPEIVAEAARRGARAAVVLSAGLGAPGPSGRSLADELLRAARPTNLRVLGPNCLGLLVPGAGLDASFAHAAPLPGRLAFVSQSGALCTAVLDWARPRGIGFSCFVSLGDSLDVDVGDVLDWLASDDETDAVLLYLESIRQGRKFMSAARAASRTKPVLVVKSGRSEEGARAAASHTGALAGADPVYAAAFRRAGMLRVLETEELFEAVETLARARPLAGERLAILTNGGGPGVMAADALVERGGLLASLDEATRRALDEVLPPTWSGQNPVDVIGDAGADRYAAALEILSRASGIDALLVMLVPTAVVSPTEVARAVAAFATRCERPVLTSWLGGPAVEEGRRVLAEAGVPGYETPEEAVAAFMHVVRYRRNRELIERVPPSAPEGPTVDRERAQALLAAALGEGRRELTEIEAKQLLSAWGIPVVETRRAASAEEAAERAGELGFPAALKILSPDISHKSDVGGVALGLEDASAVAVAARDMLERVRRHRPEARIEGFTVQRMARLEEPRELILGIVRDRVFGPVILFGHGGTAVEVIRDRAMALPPLDAPLADDLVRRTRVSRLLEAYRGRPAADRGALLEVLGSLSHLALAHPEVAELDVNPLLAGADGVLALDARVVLEDPAGATPPAIRPYPAELEEVVAACGERWRLRPVRPRDAAALERSALVFAGRPGRAELLRRTQIDYDRELVLVLREEGADEQAPFLGLGSVRFEPDFLRAEIEIVAEGDRAPQAADLLLDRLLARAVARGAAEVSGRSRPLPPGLERLALARRRVPEQVDREAGTFRLAAPAAQL